MKSAALIAALRRRATRLGVEHSEREGKGSHLFVRHAGRTTTISRHPGDMPPGTFRSILRQLGLKPSDLED
jgi:predicted RNA binding protein YcfA (HicA-like mRNA interferase family)